MLGRTVRSMSCSRSGTSSSNLRGARSLERNLNGRVGSSMARTFSVLRQTAGSDFPVDGSHDDSHDIFASVKGSG